MLTFRGSNSLLPQQSQKTIGPTGSVYCQIAWMQISKVPQITTRIVTLGVKCYAKPWWVTECCHVIFIMTGISLKAWKYALLGFLIPWKSWNPQVHAACKHSHGERCEEIQERKLRIETILFKIVRYCYVPDLVVKFKKTGIAVCHKQPMANGIIRAKTML